MFSELTNALRKMVGGKSRTMAAYLDEAMDEFDPNEPRDADGRWSASGNKAVAKVAGRIGKNKFRCGNGDEVDCPENVNDFFEKRREKKLYLLNGKKLIDEEISLYREFQDGSANENNFFKNTVAIFHPSKRPRRKPDYVSWSHYNGAPSSKYWYTKDGVIRGSDHWGSGIASCDWGLEGLTHGSSDIVKTSKGGDVYGFCKWEDFLYKADIIVDRHKKIAALNSFAHPSTDAFGGVMKGEWAEEVRKDIASEKNKHT